MARRISASVQSPIPAVLLDVIFAAFDTPHGPLNSRPPLPSWVLNRLRLSRAAYDIPCNARWSRDRNRAVLSCAYPCGCKASSHPGKASMLLLGLVDRRVDFVADRRHSLEISDDGVEVVVRQNSVECRRHHAASFTAVRPHAFDQRLLDIGVAPAPDSGLAVGVRLAATTLKPGVSKRDPGQNQLVGIRPFRGVAIAAIEDQH